MKLICKSLEEPPNTQCGRTLHHDIADYVLGHDMSPKMRESISLRLRVLADSLDNFRNVDFDTHVDIINGLDCLINDQGD